MKSRRTEPAGTGRKSEMIRELRNEVGRVATSRSDNLDYRVGKGGTAYSAKGTGGTSTGGLTWLA